MSAEPSTERFEKVLTSRHVIALAFGAMVGWSWVLVWLINSGSFSVLIAFLFVAISFLKLRQDEPDMPRPFRVTYPRLVGGGAIVLTLGLLAAFFPPSKSALAWPQEWLLMVVWGLLYFYVSTKHDPQILESVYT
jgi:amino acid transporter